jgi:hypothetical protein
LRRTLSEANSRSPFSTESMLSMLPSLDISFASDILFLLSISALSATTWIVSKERCYCYVTLKVNLFHSDHYEDIKLLKYSSDEIFLVHIAKISSYHLQAAKKHNLQAALYKCNVEIILFCNQKTSIESQIWGTPLKSFPNFWYAEIGHIASFHYKRNLLMLFELLFVILFYFLWGSGSWLYVSQ